MAYTDGCGNISFDIVEEINKHYNLKRCSAYQIRIGGVKGVLMYKPDLDGKMIEIRPSMLKFESDKLKLSVIRPATFS